MNLNKVIIAGNLTRSPELRYGVGGTAIATFGIATNRVWTDANGDRQAEVEYHNITVFGRQAQTVADYLTKGQLAMVEGRLRTTSWEVEGLKRYRTDIIAERIQFGPKRQGEVSDTDDGAVAAGRPDQGAPEADQHMDDDLPF